jgi:sarcosine oxidase subunit gamma
VCTTPGQWLFVREVPGDGLALRIAAALGDAATLIDLSDARAAVRVSGPGAREALAKFLPLDLHARVMQPGDAAATVAAHLPILLWQHDATPSYDLLCARSLGSSFHRALQLAGLAVSPAQ